VAKDDFWKWQEADSTGAIVNRDESVRLIIDSRIDAPGIFDSDKARLSFRLFADAPMSGKGPSDVRISLLLNANIGKIFGF